MTVQLEFADSLITQECILCGVTFAVTQTLVNHLRATKRDFNCPNGHSLSYTAQTEAEKELASLKRQLTEAQASRDSWKAGADRRDSQITDLIRSRDSLRGVITKMKARRR